VTGRLPAAVCWDFDGTLMDTEGVWYRVEAAFATRHGIDLPADAQEHMVGGTVDHTAAYLRQLTGAAASVAEIAAELWAECMAGLAAEPVPWHPGARELVAELRSRGVPQAVVSTSRRAYLDITLGRLAPSLFDVIVSGDDVRRHKPDPEPYLLACELLDVAPASVLVVEDSRVGVDSGLAAGCLVLAVPTVSEFRPGPRLAVTPGLVGLDADALVALFDGAGERA